MHPRLENLPGLQESFLGHRLHEKPDYGFLPHYLFFLENCHRWPRSPQIQKRILASVSSDCDVAWNEWRQFRSAQAEVSSMYLVENYLRGHIHDLEVSRPGYTKSCDMSARFDSRDISYVEVKAQSGQQHGTRHPLSKENYSFTPQGEEDLSSWLFEPRVSSTMGKPMVPYCQQASAKGADVLMAMIDIVQWETTDLCSLGQALVPDCQSFHPVVFTRTPGMDSKFGSHSPDQLVAWVFVAGAQTIAKMSSLREVWLFNESAIDRLLVIRAAETSAVLPAVDA